MREKAYCYRKFFKYPIKIYKIGEGDKAVVFSRGIEVRQMIVAFLLLLVMITFRNFINVLLPGAIQLAAYILIPWFCSGWICQKRLDGKRIDHFFKDYIFYFFRLRNTRYANDKAVYDKQLQQKQQYEQIR